MDIKIFTTGGTIDKIYFDAKNDYHVCDPQAHTVLERANAILDYQVESLMKKDSLEITDEDRAFIHDKIKAEPCNRILITHGTDTMAETGKALADLTDKTIVITGSMYPARFLESDAVFNLGAAVTAVQILPPGVYIAINGKIFDALKAKKNVELNRFEEI